MDLQRGIRRAVDVHLPGREVKAIKDRGRWVRHIIEVTLDGDETVYFKFGSSQPGWLQGSEEHDRHVERIFNEHHLPGIPAILAVDTACGILPQPYLIQAWAGGTRLGAVLRDLPEEGAAVYEAVGAFYAQMHAVRNDRDGLWNGSTPEAPWGAPTDYMYNAEIVEGSGKSALERGCISRRTYDRAVRLWADNLDYLKNHPPALVHVSPFHWTIYLEPIADGWRITKLTSIGDMMWWDPAYDIACLRYPPFGEMRPPWWEGFRRGYGPLPERKRILLYAVMQRLCAAMDVYMVPEAPTHRAWAETAPDHLEAMLDEIEDT
jgi:hypothetical protein